MIKTAPESWIPVPRPLGNDLANEELPWPNATSDGPTAMNKQITGL